MHVQCSCGKTLKVTDNLAGKKIRCPVCKAVVQVPAEGQQQIEAVQEAELVKKQDKQRPRPQHEDDETPRRRRAADDDESDDEPRSRRSRGRYEHDDDRPRRRNKGQPAASFLKRYGLYLGIGGGVAVAAVVVAILLLGRGTGGGKDGIGAAPPLANFGPPPTEEECRAFAKQLEAAVIAGNTAEVNRLYRIDNLAERCLSDLDIRPAMWQDILDKGKQRLQKNWLADDLIDSVRKGGKFTFRGIRRMDGCPCVLMRLTNADDSFDYQHALLARHPDGQIAAEDVHTLSSGERISQAIRRHWVAAAATIDQDLLRRLSAKERLYSKHVAKIAKLNQAVGKGRDQEALRIYDSLPAELQQERALLLTVLRGIKNNDDYIRVLETIRKHHGTDPTAAHYSLRYHFDKKEFDQALECVDRLDQSVGGDAYLHLQRGNITIDAGRLVDAKRHIEQAIREEPDLQEAYWGRINAALKESNHADTLVWLKKYAEQFGLTIDEEELKKNADYAAFLKSPQFREFQEWQKSRQK